MISANDVGSATNEAKDFWQHVGAIFETDERFIEVGGQYQNARQWLNLATDATLGLYQLTKYKVTN